MKIVSSEIGDTPISGNFHWEDDDQPTVRGIPRFLNKPIWYHTAVKQLIIFRHLGSKQLSSLSKGITGTHVLLYKKMVASPQHRLYQKKCVYIYICIFSKPFNAFASQLSHIEVRQFLQLVINEQILRRQSWHQRCRIVVAPQEGGQGGIERSPRGRNFLQHLVIMEEGWKNSS